MHGSECPTVNIVLPYNQGTTQAPPTNLVLSQAVPLEHDHTLALEIKRYAALLSHLATRLGHRRPNLTGRSVDVIRQTLYQKPGTPRAIRLKEQFLKVGLIGLRGFLDVALDDVLGHLRIAGLAEDIGEGYVGGWVGPTGFRPGDGWSSGGDNPQLQHMRTS